MIVDTNAVKKLTHIPNVLTRAKVNVNNLSLLMPDNIRNDDTERYLATDNYRDAWDNLLREWFSVSIRKDIETTLYWARVKRRPDIIKIGISYDLDKRAAFKNNRCYDYHIIRKFPNRYQCAYAEYKLRTLFCFPCSEMLDVTLLSDVIRYVKNLHYNDTVHNELELLGWGFFKNKR